MSNIFIIDDQPLLVAGLSTYLEQNGHQIVGCARSAADLAAQLATAKADLIICGHTLPGITGVELLQELRGRGDDIHFILYFENICGQVALQAIEAGVNGILTKDEAPELLLTSIRIVEQGGNWIDAKYMRAAMHDNNNDDRWPSLSVAERRIAKYAATGLHNREIANKSGLTEGTVKVHLNRIFRKLGIDSRLQLVREFGTQ
jgi:DNA-binding NarL/FixJ family response regulator